MTATTPLLATVRLTADPAGSRLEVNGEEVRAKAAQVTIAAGEVPTVAVWQFAGEAVIEGQGIVQVMADGGSPKAALLEWLALLDPEELERQALDRQGWGSAGLAKDILQVIAELAEAQLP